MPIADVLREVNVDYKETGNGYISFKLPGYTYEWYATPNGYFANRAGESSELYGSGPFALLKNLFGMSFKEAMRTLYGPADERWVSTGNALQGAREGFQKGRGAAFVKHKEAQKNIPKKNLVLPKEAVDKNGKKMTRQVWAFLTQYRHIDSNIVNEWIRAGIVKQGSIEKTKDGKLLPKPINNVMFVGYDREGKPAHAAIRGIDDKYHEAEKKNGKWHPFKGEAIGSNKDFSARWVSTKSDKARVYESTIDAMSWCSLHPNEWKDCSHIILNGVGEGALFTFLHDHPVKDVVIGLDHDDAGEKAFQVIKEKLSVRYPSVTVAKDTSLAQYEGIKDWNELLTRKWEAEKDGKAFDVVETYESSDFPVNDVGNNFEFSNGTITNYLGKDADVVIPKMIEGVLVTSIASRAFADSGIHSVTVPESLQSIGYRAFEGCTSLESVSGLDNADLQKVGDSAFERCTALQSLDFPDGLKEIGDNAFLACSKLEDVNIHDGLDRLGRGAFAGCVSLEALQLPEGLECIKEDTFRSCSNLSDLEIPSSVTEIQDGAFASCVAFQEVELPPGSRIGRSFVDSGIETVVADDTVIINSGAFQQTDFFVDQETNEVKEITVDRSTEIEFLSERKEISDSFTDGPVTERSVPFREERSL